MGTPNLKAPATLLAQVNTNIFTLDERRYLQKGGKLHSSAGIGVVRRTFCRHCAQAVEIIFRSGQHVTDDEEIVSAVGRVPSTRIFVDLLAVPAIL